jgi:hypothetical protein
MAEPGQAPTPRGLGSSGEPRARLAAARDRPAAWDAAAGDRDLPGPRGHRAADDPPRTNRTTPRRGRISPTRIAG